MPTFENTGLRIVQAADVDAFTAAVDGLPHERPHVVRLDPAGRDWTALHDAGGVVRPSWVHWVCPVTDGVADVIARQSRTQRQRTKQALRAMDPMTRHVSWPIDPAIYDEWLELYTAQVGRMRYGRNFGRIFRKSMLAPGSRQALVVWLQEGCVVCGSVVTFDTERAALVVGFSAVATAGVPAELARGMYVSLADLAAEHGLRWVTLGNDVNFYGAVVRPGLCAFKLRLGYLPVPSDLFGRVNEDLAERVTNLCGLEPPVLRFAYRRPRDPGAGLADFMAGPDALALVSVAPAGEPNEVLESLPEHRRLVLDA